MSLRREIAALAVPAIITNITTPLLSLADMAVTGHIGGADYIGAVALGGTLFNTLYWLFNFLRMGTTGLTAQVCHRPEAASRVLWQSLLLAGALGVLLIALSEPICRTALAFMDADDGAAALADRYFRIVIWGAPAMLGTYATLGWLIGMQNTRATMAVALTANIFNIALSCFLVFGLSWTIEGVATGTLAAQWTGFLCALLIIGFKYRPEAPKSFKSLVGSGLWRFVRVNSDIFLRTACLVAVTLWFTHSGATSGVDVLAANALLLQLFMLFSFFMDGFAYAAEALAGKYHGIADTASLSRLVRLLERIGAVCAAVCALVFLFGAELLMKLLTDDANVISVAREYVPWVVAMPLCGFTAFIYDGILVGLTRTRLMLLAMACAMALFFGLYMALPRSNHFLWLAFDAYLLTRGVVEAIGARNLKS